MENVELHGATPGEYFIRIGTATEEKKPLPLKIDGMLSAPSEFLLNKSTEYEAAHAHLLIDKDALKLQLVLDEFDPNSRDVITGTLSEDVELKKFKINTSERWTVKEFLQFVRERKLFFAEYSDQTKLLQSLQKWDTQITRVIKQHNDNHGNSEQNLETKVAAVEGLISKFKLNIPLFKGYSKEVFTVEIGLDPKATSVDIFLFSDELFELRLTRRDSIFDAETKKFDAMGFACSKINIS